MEISQGLQEIFVKLFDLLKLRGTSEESVPPPKPAEADFLPQHWMGKKNIQPGKVLESNSYHIHHKNHIMRHGQGASAFIL